MSDKSAIEWTDSTWNPATGCTKVSPACANCYIERTPPFRIAGRRFVRGHIPVQLHPDRLEQPMRRKKPRRIFVNSLSDLFHEQVPTEFIDRVFAVMARASQHTFQVLTKRPQRMLDYLADARELELSAEVLPLPLPNVWLGVSVENQHFADERIPLLLQTPAAVRFLSCEPLLGPVDLTRVYYYPDHEVDALTGNGWTTSDRVWLGHPFGESNIDRGVEWVIVGGESGPRVRPMQPEWVRSIRDQCVAAGVPFFFKQWGGRTPKAGGRLLDGRTWDEMPVTHQAVGV